MEGAPGKDLDWSTSFNEIAAIDTCSIKLACDIVGLVM